MNKKILLTGASGGIGKSLCEKLISSDHTMILISSNDEKIEYLKKNYGNKHFYYKIDLSDMQTLPDKLKLINEKHNDIEVLINNAGITQDNLLMRMSWE